MSGPGAVLRYLVIGMLVLVAGHHGCKVAIDGPVQPPASLAVLATGAPIHGANGLTSSEAGGFYVASRLGDEILTLDADTGELISTVSANQGVVGPDDIVIGPDGEP